MTRGVLKDPRPLSCANCGKEFLAFNGRQTNCSPKCKRERQYALRLARFQEGGSRKCSRCQEIKPADAFTFKAFRCKPCQAEAAREHRDANPDYNRIKKLSYHGLTPGSFGALLASQDGRCAICRRPEPAGHGKWHVDHDHRCCPGQYGCAKCIRGLLCHYCNLMIGMAQEDPATLQAAIDYLRRSNAPPPLRPVAYPCAVLADSSRDWRSVGGSSRQSPPLTMR